MSYQNEINKILSNYNYVGLNTLLIKDGKTFTSVNGYKDLETKEKLDENSIFRIASVSKVIVALGIMKLHEEHKLNVLDDISKYLGYTVRNPHFPDTPITIEMVMTQTSSISDGSDNVKGYDGVNGPKVYISLQDLLTNPNYEYYLDRTFTTNAPGSKWEYSNFGCGILACIIEKVSGMYFSDYIRKEILLPLGIDGSFRISDIVNKDKVVALYDINKNNEFVMQRNLDLFLKYEYPKYELGDNFRMPAGGLFISILDLSKVMQLLMNKGTYQNIKIFEPETIEFMKEVHWEGVSDDLKYRKKGLQLLIWDNYGTTLYGHFGSAYGLRSFMLFDDKVGMISFCNGADFGKVNKKGVTSMQNETLELMTSYIDENTIKKSTIERIRKFVSDRDWDQFHTDENLAKSIVLEATEVLELFQWSSECKSEEDLKEEIADVLTYVIMLCDKNNYDMDEIINKKLDKTIKKYPVDKSYGQSKKYNEL